MDGSWTAAVEQTENTVSKEEIKNNQETITEFEDEVPDWIAKAYGSKSDKKSFYDSSELVSFQKLITFYIASIRNIEKRCIVNDL